jgi:predicted SnoaL-like aldol condensation-catalyzing enzyme
MPPLTLKGTAMDFLTRVVAGDVRGAFERHVAEGFRHHNPYFAGDRESLRAGMEEDAVANPGKRLDVQAALQDGDRVAVHSRLRRSASEPDIAVVHIFRFEGEKIVEMWDVVQIAPPRMANEGGMF